MTDTTKFLDLDAVKPATELVVGLGGMKHTLVPVTVEAFLANTTLIDQMREEGGISTRVEFELVIKLLLRSFPTMTDAMLRGLTFDQLKQLQAFAQNNDGTDQVNKEAAAEAAANPQPTES